MRFLHCGLLLVLIFASRTVAAGETQLLKTGLFHEGDVTALTGEEWYGVFRLETTYEVKKVAIRVEQCFDSLVDKEGEKTGLQVSVPGEKEEPLFLVRGISGIKEGPVKTVFDGACPIAPPGAFLGVRLGEGYKHELKAEGQVEEQRTIKDYRLFYEGREIFRHDGYLNDAIPELLWAGDLDSDGKLDLYMDLNVHYAGRNWTLFLSTCAKEGESLGIAARMGYTAC